MRTVKTTSMAEDVMRLHQALTLSLKGIRAVAERLKKDATEAQVKAQMDTLLTRSFLGQKRPPIKPPKERPTEGDRRLHKVGRVLAALSDSQLNLVMGLARSMVRELPKGGRPTKGPSPMDEKRLPSAGGDQASSHSHTIKGKD